MVTINRATTRLAEIAARFKENPAVGRVVRKLANRAEEGGASSIMFLPQRGVKYDAYAFAYHTNLTKEMNVPSPPSGSLRGTVVINVSGHDSGRIEDRVAGWAEDALMDVGFRVGDDAKKLLAVRAASTAAMSALSRDGGKSSATIEVEGKKVELPRATFDKMQRATNDSTDDELVALAEAGDIARRRFFAATNVYNVSIRGADGSVHTEQVQRNHPDRIEFATRIPVEIPAGTGTAVLEAWPQDSAGVGGYREGRHYEIHLGGAQFDLRKAQQAAEAYEASHPEIRWDTDEERADLKKHGVNPSPRPYQDF